MYYKIINNLFLIICILVFTQPVYLGDWNVQSKKVRPQKLQKTETLHAPQNKKLQISNNHEGVPLAEC